jgi:hypothetical protein
MQDTCDALQYQQRPVGYKILQAHLFGGTWETRRLYAFFLVWLGPFNFVSLPSGCDRTFDNWPVFIL